MKHIKLFEEFLNESYSSDFKKNVQRKLKPFTDEVYDNLADNFKNNWSLFSRTQKRSHIETAVRDAIQEADGEMKKLAEKFFTDIIQYMLNWTQDTKRL